MSEITIPANSVTVTCIAPVNIAVIKYWGKRDSKLILPTNSSLSGTIHMDSMRSRTTIVASQEYDNDYMTLNGKDENMSGSKRLNAVLNALRQRAEDLVDEQGKVLIAAADWPKYKLRIISDNNFPTAAGLASSASGFACFTKCLATLFNFKEKFPGELTSIARQGSGSACRSLDGGFVKWMKGKEADGSDSYAVQVAPETHWPEMRVLILVAHDGRKEVPSTSGMETTTETSTLHAYRVSSVVEERADNIEKAILAKDFNSFAEITMKDSNQFHATCLDTYPPIFYLNNASKRIINVIHSINDICKAEAKPYAAAYTFDAGPNAVLYCLEEYLDSLVALFKYVFEHDVTEDWASDPLALTFIGQNRPAVQVPQSWLNAVSRSTDDHVSKMYVSKLGPGAEVIDKRTTF